MIQTEAAGRPPLATELHTATRVEHAALNRTIMGRLPLCLPTATSTSSLYAQGMNVFGQIYYGIEDAWDHLLSDRTLDPQTRDMIIQLDVLQLKRRKRLDKSLHCLATRTRCISAAHMSHLQKGTQNFRNDIRQSILSKPHLILAHTWTMYLALFNGGRWIARQLLSAGPAFWRDPDRATTVNGALSFWFFGDSEDYDGEDIKLAFKDRFATAAENLTDVERDEVVAESKRLFQLCATLIAFLDEHVQPDPITQDDLSTFTKQSEHKAESQETSVVMLGSYLASYAPVVAANKLWQTLFRRLPSAQDTIPLPLRQEIEQKHV